MEDLDEICVDYEQGRTWKTYALAAVAVIACVAMAFPSIYRAPYELIGEGRTIYSGYLALLPLILLSTIVGFDPAVIAAFMLLGARCFYLHSFSYDACLYLLASACAWIVGRNRWFRHIPLSFIASLFYAVCMGGIRLFFHEMVTGHGWDQLTVRSVLHECAVAYPASFLACLISYLYMRFAPDSWKVFFRGSFEYSSRFEKYEQLIRADGKQHSHMSSKIILVTFVKTVFACLLSGLFAAILLENMQFGDMFVHARRSLRSITNEGLEFCTKLILLMMTTAVPVMVIINWFFSYKIISPIVRMAQFMRGFERTTEKRRKSYVRLLHQLRVNSHDELADLFHSIDRSISEINIFIEALERDQKLSEDLRVAQASNEAKSTFLSNMSHEIRTPINSVLGFDEMILRECTEPNIIAYANDIKNSGKVLLNLVNDILDFSKIEAGKMEIIPVEYELASIINDLVNMINMRAREKKLAFKVVVDENTPHLLFGDEMRLKQVMLNILTNAVKYTHTGSVTFRIGYEKVSSQHIMLTVHVIDTGIGIKVDELQKMFRPFERVDEVRNRTIEGTGLGMSIIRGLLQQMGSGLEVKSEYGKGSDFSFSVRQRVVSWGPIGNYEVRYEDAKEEKVNYQELFRAPNAKVLVVDDTKLNLTVFCGLLKNTQIQIDTAESGIEMLDKVQKKDYDLLFIDHRMPEMDGVEALHELKKLTSNHNSIVPAIALTANAINGAREMYLTEGFTDYLSKPINSRDLEKLLMRFLPPEKVQIVHGEKTPEVFESKVDREAVKEFSCIEGIDAAIALTNCGSPEVLRDALKDFYDAIPSKSFNIENLWHEKKIRDYTVLVHALKSSARLIGAMQLSKAAAHLEQCGDDGNLADIDALTPELLATYKSYRDKLEPFFVMNKTEESNEEKPAISEEEFAEAMVGIRDFVDMGDFANAEEILSQMENFTIGSEFAVKYAEVRRLVSTVDRNALLEYLKNN